MAEPWGNEVGRQQAKVFRKLRQEVRKLVKRGVYKGFDSDDRFKGTYEPLGGIETLEERLKRGYDPLVEMAVIATDPRTHIALRVAANAKVAEYVYGSLKAPEVMAALAANNITVQIAPFAAGQQRLPAPEAEPRKVEAEVVEDDVDS